jgi:hypothetical protein
MGGLMTRKLSLNNELCTPELYDPKRAGQLHSFITQAIDEFLNLHPMTLKSEVITAIEVTRDAYEKELYHRWLGIHR